MAHTVKNRSIHDRENFEKHCYNAVFPLLQKKIIKKGLCFYDLSLKRF